MLLRQSSTQQLPDSLKQSLEELQRTLMDTAQIVRHIKIYNQP